MSLAEYLAACEQQYSPEHHLLGGPFHGPGYHSGVADGTYVHDILNSLNYAIALLMSGEEPHGARAADIIRKVLSLQDADPTRRTYGIWPWLLEEPLDRMPAPDWNWADFGGARLAHLLKEHAARLPEDLVGLIKAGLAHAAWSIFRRNMAPSYTNIAVMGSGVALAAGELLAIPRLADYGRRRLHNLVAHTKFHGGFNEYNSPTYTMVALHECERMLGLVENAAARADADWLRRIAWLTIAEHFHPGTGQWAGPHSRDYGLRMGPATAEFIAEQTGVDILMPPSARAPRPVAPPQFRMLPCPSQLAPRFREVPEKDREIRRRFIRRQDDAASTWGTTWFAEDACLGSVSQDNLWTQRHVVLAYWRLPDGPPAALRLRFLHDGRDFASAMVRSTQGGPRVLSAFSLASDRGDFHHVLDRPADGVFQAEDLRVRYELTAPGAAAREVGRGRFEIEAGPWRAVIHTMPGRFGKDAVAWSAGKEDGRAFVDGVCYSGPRTGFEVHQVGEVVVAAGLELLVAGAPAAEAAPSIDDEKGGVATVVWMPPGGGLVVTAPTRAQPYPK